MLSLGVYTWVEHSLRDKLAGILDASISARKEVEGRRKVELGNLVLVELALLFVHSLSITNPCLHHFLISVYQHREGSTWVILVNLIFGLLTMFHLAYLGVMFDQSSPEQVAIRVRKMERVTNISLR